LRSGLTTATAACVAVAWRALLLWADNFARWLFVVELPLGVVTCACGIPIFLVLLRRASRSWND
jgi:iron complex transport system permease protein